MASHPGQSERGGGFVLSERKAVGSAHPTRGFESRVPLKRLWSDGPSPGLRPPSPGGRGVAARSRVPLVRWPLTRPTATLSRGERGRGAVSGSFGQMAPHPAYGHPLPGGEGSRRGLGFLWSNGPSPSLRPPSPGGRGVAARSRVPLVKRPLTQPTATLSRGERGRGAVSGSFGQTAPHPAYGHPLPGGEGSRRGLGFLWSNGPSPGLRPPSPGGEGVGDCGPGPSENCCQPLRRSLLLSHLHA